MDLSGIIFVVLAVGWAGYLIPKALKHHDDLAMSRPVDTFSDSVRVVGATRVRGPVAEPVTTPTTATAAAASAPVARTITREAARRAARRRRRVLAVLVVGLLAVAATSFVAYTPWWSTAVPGLLIVAFLVVARLTVRAQQVRRAAPVQPSTDTSTDVIEEPTAVRAAAPVEVEPDLGRENTAGLSREELAEAVATPVLDEAGLWDPLPMTLPTYVNKARARRTVRTIEITGMTSSGHDVADSELARSAEELAAAMVEVDAQITEDARKAAGA